MSIILKYLVLAVVTFAILHTVVNIAERHECDRWAKEAETDPGYTILRWQRDQCEHHKKPLNAPVRQYLYQGVLTTDKI